MRSSGWKKIIAFVLCMVMVLSLGANVISAEDNPAPAETETGSPAQSPVTIEVTDPEPGSDPAPEGEPASEEGKDPNENPDSQDPPAPVSEPVPEPNPEPVPTPEDNPAPVTEPAPTEDPAPAVNPEPQPGQEAAPAQPAADTTEQTQVPSGTGSDPDANTTATPGTPAAAANGEAAPAKEKEEEKKPEEVAPLAKKLEKTIQSVSGATVKVTLDCDDAAELPEGAELAVREVVPDTPEYQGFLDTTAAKLQIEDVDRITLSRFFDLAIWKDGVKIQPKAPVKVKIEYTSPAERNEGDTLSVVHFADTGAGVVPEIIPNVNAKSDLTEISFQQGSFSVTAIVLVDPETEEPDEDAEEKAPVEDAEFSAEVFDPATQQTIAVHMMVPAESLPAPAEELSLAVKVIQQNQDAVEVVEDQIEDSEDTARETILFDIALMHEGEEIEPLGPVSVTFEGIEVPNDDAQIFHVQEDASAATVEEIPADTTAQGEIVMETDHFSLYAVTYTVESYFKTFSGETFKITLNYDDAAELPVGAELKVEELLPGTQEYASYLEASAEKLEIEDVSSISFARFFDITIMKDGEKVEPKAAVDVKIEYAEETELAEGDTLSVVHFADAGTEVIEDVEANEGLTEISFAQESFSVTGTIVTEPVAPEHYAVILKANDRYYSVKSDGTIIEVEYSEEDNTARVQLDYPLFWEYVTEKVNWWEQNTYTNLRIPSEASGFDGYNLPDWYYYRYIDPADSNGITDEPHVSGTPAARQQHPTYVSQCAIEYTDHKVKSLGQDLYIGIDLANQRIVGQKSAAEAAEVYLAKVENVPPSGNLNHTVNHIDISIEGGASLNLPLAYGTYYYYVNGEQRILDTTNGTDVTLKLSTDRVDISVEDMKKAQVTAFSKERGVLNDAFYISGYSQNKDNDISTVQIRLEGSFKVSDLDPYHNPGGEDSLTSDQLQARLDNRIYYTVTVNKDITFDWEYEYEPGRKAQLYNAEEEPLSSTFTVNLSKSFDYWDEENECPPVTWNRGTWRKGHIIWDTSENTGTGMDFKLKTKTEDEANVLAVEIFKFLQTDDGHELHPALPVTNQFIVYQKAPASQTDIDGVVGVGVNGSGNTADYSGYKSVHNKSIVVGNSGEGTVYDYDVVPGMVYVQEDAASVPDEIIDQDGNRWVYSSTRVETEYVWRPNDSNNNSRHKTTGFWSIPEVLGVYGTWDNEGVQEQLNNKFLEFYVYNIYEKDVFSKKEIQPYEGTGVLGAVQVGDEIEYEISYKNYKTSAANIVIKDQLDPNVEFVSASDEGSNDNGVVTWTLSNVPAGKEGTVTLTVKVLEGAMESKGGTGKVVNGGDTSTVKVGNDNEFQLNEVENTVPDPPVKSETNCTGTGLLGYVKPGDKITYQISYKNYQTETADIVITDTLDPNVCFRSAEPECTRENGVVTWVIEDVAPGEKGVVLLVVEVLDSAMSTGDSIGKVVNGGDTATVKVGNDKAFTLNTVENPIPHKKETSPYKGTGTLGLVGVGDEITYEISYKNYKDVPATITITDKLDQNVEYVSASNDGTNVNGIVTWTLNNVPAGEEGAVNLTVLVKDSALSGNNGPGEVVNGGDGTTVKVGDDSEFTLETVENPIPEKKEKRPYEGIGVLGPVLVDGEIEYEISYYNYKDEEATVTIKDTLDQNVVFVSASDDGQEDNGIVTWTISDVPADTRGSVTLKVKVLEDALETNGGPGKVVNGGEHATVQIGNDPEASLNTVENPVPDNPVKKETNPYTGTGALGGVAVGQQITYEISYKNYKNTAATVTITDKLDDHVKYINATVGTAGTETQIIEPTEAAGGTVTWTIEGVPANTSGKVELTVEVLSTALKDQGAGSGSEPGPGKVVNGGNTSTVKVGDDRKFTLNTVENPVPSVPFKTEISIGDHSAALLETTDGGANDHGKDREIYGAAKPGDIITYRIEYENYHPTEKGNATIVIEDVLDPNVTFVEASYGTAGSQTLISKTNGSGTVVTNAEDVRKVTWTISGVEPQKSGYVTLQVRVKESALVSYGAPDNPGPGKVRNQASTKLTLDGGTEESPFWTNVNENPVPEPPHKKETSPYEGNGTLGLVSVGQEITYEISYENYYDKAVDILIKDKLDTNVEFVEASDDGRLINGVVTWKLTEVEAKKSGRVTVKVKVLPGAIDLANLDRAGLGKVVNGGSTSTVKIGDDNESILETVENPIPVKKETVPYAGIGSLGYVKPEQEITYSISYKNYKTEEAQIIIKDTLDPNVEYVSSTQGGFLNEGVVTWNLTVQGSTSGSVSLTVKVKDSALSIGKVVNDGNSASVQIDDDNPVPLNTVENPIPLKKETAPYSGTGTLGLVGVGTEITYQISYKNYQPNAATVKINDVLDPNVEYVTSSPEGAYSQQDHKVTWTLENVPAGKEDVVSLTVKVKDSAVNKSNIDYSGFARVINDGDTATVKVGTDSEFQLNTIENPIPVKKETDPYQGIGTLGPVAVGDDIQYSISYKNYKTEEAKIVITDTLDPNVKFKAASNDGENNNGTVTWNLNVAPGGSGQVTLTVTVLPTALNKDGIGNVVNSGATLQVQGGPEITLNPVQNPVLSKKEVSPYEGIGTLGTVNVGQEITYSISYKNYKDQKATVHIVDKLDENVEYISSDPEGTYNEGDHEVTWNLENVDPDTSGTVQLTVKVKETDLNGDVPEKVVNTGTTVRVDTDDPIMLPSVENPVIKLSRSIQGTAWYDEDQDGVRGDGDRILPNTWVYLYWNNPSTGYKEVAKVITDDQGEYTFEGLAGGDYVVEFDVKMDVTKKAEAPNNKNSIADSETDGDDNPLSAKINITLPSDEVLLAMTDGSGPTLEWESYKDGKYTKKWQDAGFISNQPVEPTKKEISPYKENEKPGAVGIGDEITYQIDCQNYKTHPAKIVITDTLDPNVEFVFASDNGEYDAETRTVTWTFLGVQSRRDIKVTLKVKVLSTALEPGSKTGKVVNGGKTATVKIGNDDEVELDEVENPVIDINRKIEGTAWFDENQDGVRQDTDPLLKDVPVELYRMTDDGPVKVAETKTDENGFYTFERQPEGEYQVVFVNPEEVTKKSDTPDGKNSIADGQKGDNGLPKGGIISNIKLPSDDEIVKMFNDGQLPDGTYVKDQLDAGFIADPPTKKEVKPYEGTGFLGAVNVGDTISYEITYKNYQAYAADVVIKDKLDANVSFVSASDNGVNNNGEVTWTLKAVAPGKSGKVTLSVKVLGSALTSQKGPGKVVNGGDTATVQVGNGKAYTLDKVENPVSKLNRTIQGIAWVDKNKNGVREDTDTLLGNVKIKLYQKQNDGTYKLVKSTVTNKEGFYKFDGLDGGTYQVVFDRAQTTTTKADEADGKNSIVEEQLDENGKPIGAVISEITLPSDEELIKLLEAGDLPGGTFVKDHQDGGFVPEPAKAPHKSEVAPYKGDGTLGSVKVGQEITYEISYQNYTSSAATVTIKDTLDKNVEFVKASNDGKLENGVVTWTIDNVAAGKEDSVTLTVKVLEGALKTKQGPGKVVNGGQNATVQIGSGTVYKLNIVTNPVAADSGSSRAGGSPRTGDSPMLYVYIGVSLAALIALIVLGAVSRRKKKSQE